MAKIFEYYCKKCNISITESEGKSSRGFRYKCKCMKCNSCGSIGDRTTESRLDNGDWEDVPMVCSCGSTDLSEWSFKCPKCGRFVSKKSTGLTCD